MVKKLISFILLMLFCTLSSNAQERVSLKGRVIGNNILLENVHARNITTGRFTITDPSGEFSIPAKVGDTLLFSYVGMADLVKFIDSTDVQKKVLQIRMTESTNELKEVTLNNVKEINAVSLGIIPKDIKVPTAYERRLQTAGDFKWIHLLGILGGNLQIDPILNAINGRTKKIKQNILVEKKIQNIAFLEGYTDYMSKDLKMSKEEIRTLISLTVEDPEIQLVIDSKNDNRVKFFLLDRWLKYQKDQE